VALTSAPQSPQRLPLIAVVGNPNAGKTTIFNALTGASQKVANYPGVTVERVSAKLKLGERDAECVDVPGLYSMDPVSEDERVAVEVLRGQREKPDLLVCVLDATNLERNLFFYSQLSELRLPMIVALTMVDRLPRKGLSLDVEKLSKLLGVQVVPVVGHKATGLDALRDAITNSLTEAEPALPISLAAARSDLLRERLARSGVDLSESEIQLALAGAGDVSAAAEVMPELQSTLNSVLSDPEVQPAAMGAADRYRWAGTVQKAVVSREGSPRSSNTDRLDAVLTHRVFGLAIFLGVMYLVFQSIYTLAGPLMEGIEWLVSSIQGLVGPPLEGVPVLQSLIVDGLVGGVGSVLVFLPQILILFFFIALLEGSGYLARAAFLMDKTLGWCGLNGRAFIPLLSSFACAIPGIMSARVMPDQRSRLATILVAPLMSCSARLPVYVLLIGAFIEPKFGAAWAGFTLFAMHLLGLLVAIPVVWFLNRGMLKGKRLPFVLELPSYQWPKWRDVRLAMYFRGKVFLQTAGTIIVLLSVVIWALSYFPRSDEAAARYEAEYAATQAAGDEDGQERFVAERLLENSFLGRFGKTIEPIFLPAGFDWRITTAILAAFPAREVVVPSLGIIFSLGGDVDEESPDLRTAIHEATWPDGRPLVTPFTAVGLMVFFALCCQCMATLATVRRETNSWRWPVFMFTYMTTLAYLSAVGIRQLELFLGG
jgi:ferrous iron transport protein B